MSPDTVSSLFPDRPIRPLPRRRLRERLSPEVADTIKYPPSTYASLPLFHYPPYSLKDEGSPPSLGSVSPTETVRRTESGQNSQLIRRNGVGVRAGDDGDSMSRSTLVTRSPPEILSRASGRSSRPDQARQSHNQPPPSAASSADGYDSFENTNNKKKRKIPTAGDSNLNSGHGISPDATAHATVVDAQSPISDLGGDRSYYNSVGYVSPGVFGPGGTGMSGSGRGRLGRSRNGRSPLRALPDGNNTWAGRATKPFPPHWTPADYGGSGIISNAIANAGKLPPQGQENVSLLQQHSSVKPTPSTQFTFTCDSQVPGSLQWPGHMPKHPLGSQIPQSAPHVNATVERDTSSKAASRGSGSSRRKGRRRLERELNTAALHRRQAATDAYFHNPPKPEDIWICEFCEYERIFGQPPRALIRDYELKDRRVRQEEADRKRLLEKAKAKARKGKKNGKAPVKAGNAANHADETQPDEHSVPPPHPINGHSTQSEEDDAEEEHVADYGEDSNRPQLDPDPHDKGGTVYPRPTLASVS